MSGLDLTFVLGPGFIIASPVSISLVLPDSFRDFFFFFFFQKFSLGRSSQGISGGLHLFLLLDENRHSRTGCPRFLFLKGLFDDVPGLGTPGGLLRKTAWGEWHSGALFLFYDPLPLLTTLTA